MSTNYPYVETTAEWANRRIRQLETALAQSEAGAAALRRALEIAMVTDLTGNPHLRKPIDAALSTTAGAEFLAEMQDLRDRLAKAEGERAQLVEDCKNLQRTARLCAIDKNAVLAELSTARESAEKLAGAVAEVVEDLRGNGTRPPMLWMAEEKLTAALAAHRKGEK